MPLTDVDCIVIGAGPAGLAAVRALLDGEVGNILVVDRDEAPGGLPQYCRHPGFGWGYTHRLETGPAFVRRMAAVLADPRVTFLPSTTATAICGGPAVDLLGPICGMATVRARAVLVATGIRERPRGAQLVPGQRPERGVLTTGQLQQMVARGVPLPGRRMVVGRHRARRLLDPADGAPRRPSACWYDRTRRACVLLCNARRRRSPSSAHSNPSTFADRQHCGRQAGRGS